MKTSTLHHTLKKALNAGLLLAAGLAATAVPGTAALAQYPDKPIRLIVPYPPGTGTDSLARYTARRLEEKLGKPVPVENRTGAFGFIAAQAVTGAAPDGYTLLFTANAPVATNVAAFKKLPYDPVKDLDPVALLAYGPMGVFVPAASPFNSVKELIEFARQNPKKLNYGFGSATYSIATEWFLSLGGAQGNGVPYKGAAPALADLAGGRLDFVVADYSGAIGLLKGNKLKILAVTVDKRIAAEPNVPTLQELGYKDFFQVAWWAVFAPAKTPRPVVEVLEKTLLAIYADAETSALLAKSNFTAFGGDARKLREFQMAEIDKDTRVSEKAGLPKE